jgi:predicted  nucleic acid-binding Zn-ribbon protein
MEVSIEHRLTEVEERSKSNTKRLDDMKKKQDDLDELVSTVKVLATREESVENDVKEIKSDVKSLANKSGQKWDAMIKSIITAVAAAIVGYIFAQLGM